MSQLEVVPKDSDLDGQLRVPRLCLLYLVLWIGATAILLAIDLAEDVAFGRSVPKVGPWTTCLLHAMGAAVFGAVLVAAGVLVRISRFSRIDRLQPGHWFVVNSAAVGLLNALLAPLWRYTRSEASLGVIGAAVCMLMSTALFWFATTQLRETEQWKGAFRVFAFTHLLGAFALISFVFLTPSSMLSGLLIVLLMFPVAASALLALICFLSSLAVDLRMKCHRDWLHWLGVAAVAISPMIRVAWKLARHFALP